MPSPRLTTLQTDVFDKEDFDVVSFVNTTFPTEESLKGLDPLIGAIKQQMCKIDNDILQAVRQQSISGNRAERALQEAQATIQELGSSIREIQRRAAASEALVQEICTDIRKLDSAKRHLTLTITGLRRLAMLMNAVSQLQVAVERFEYAEAGQLLQAVRELAAHFASYTSVPKIAELRGRFAALESSLRISVLREFDLLGEEIPGIPVLERLKNCCAAVDALGYSSRDELVDKICRKEMSIYTAIFGTIGDTARLDRTANRYKWLLRRLETRRDVFTIFPAQWRVPQLVTVTFCSVTKAQMAEILDGMATELPHHVEGLLKAVEAANIFELEMAQRFDTTEGTTEGPALEDMNAHMATTAIARTAFKGAISSVYAPYLYTYIAQVERELLWSVEKIISEETWTPISSNSPVLRSSNELVEAMRSELNECTSRVTRGKILLDLAAAFKKVFREYARRMVTRLPKTVSGGQVTGGHLPILGSTEWLVKFNDCDWEVVCLIITTAEHCQDMVGQLCKAIAAKLEPSTLAEQLDFSGEEEEFSDVITTCLHALLLGLETRFESALTTMNRVNWSAIETVGDQSEWTGQVRAAMVDIGGRLGHAMPANLFKFLLDRLLRSFAPRLRENIFKCRKLSDVGCQQLRLDLEGIKGAFAATAKSCGEDSDVQSFVGDVSWQLSSAEAILKIAGAPVDGFVDTFTELMPGASAIDFQRILDLKILKKGEQQLVLEQFYKRTGNALPLSPPNVGVSSEPTHQQGLASLSRMMQHGATKARFDKLNMQAASGSVRETMGRTLGAMKSLRFSMQKDS